MTINFFNLAVKWLMAMKTCTSGHGCHVFCVKHKKELDLDLDFFFSFLSIHDDDSLDFSADSKDV